MKNWNQVVDLKKTEDTCDDEHVNYSYISDTTTSTSIIQDGNMVHNSAPNDISSDSKLENVIIRKKKQESQNSNKDEK